MRTYNEVTWQCNNLCRFCRVVSDKRLLPHRGVGEICQDLEAARQKGIDFVVFSGGEPTVHPDLELLVAEARKLGFCEIQIQTNGRLFDDSRWCDRILRAGASEFMVSLHGISSSTHDWLTRVPGSFDETVAAIRNLVSAGSTVLTNTVITKANYHELPAIVDLVASLGAVTIQLAYLHIVGRAVASTGQLLVRKSQAAPLVCLAMDVPVAPHVTKMVEGLPACCLPQHEKFSADLFVKPSYLVKGQRCQCFDKRSVRSKGPRCSECCFDTLCQGPWREYPEQFGWDEFQPIREMPLNTVLAHSLDDIQRRKGGFS